MPWPKGRPMPAEIRAKIAASSSRARAAQSPEERDAVGRKISAALKRAWAELPVMRERCLPNLCRDPAHIAKTKSAHIAHLTDEQRLQYRDLRRKRFSKAEALALVETGRLP